MDLNMDSLFVLPLLPYLGFILISLEREERGEIKTDRWTDRETDRGGIFIPHSKRG